MCKFTTRRRRRPPCHPPVRCELMVSVPIMIIIISFTPSRPCTQYVCTGSLTCVQITGGRTEDQDRDIVIPMPVRMRRETRGIGKIKLGFLSGCVVRSGWSFAPRNKAYVLAITSTSSIHHSIQFIQIHRLYAVPTGEYYYYYYYVLEKRRVGNAVVCRS